MSFFKSFFQRFSSDERGNILILFGMLAVPLMVFAGGAIDLSRKNAVESSVQSALDAAILSAAISSPNTGETREDIARRFFAANLAAQHASALPDISLFKEAAGVITAQATAFVPTTTLGLAGLSNLPVSVSAEIRTQTKNAEVVLVLDFSDSMLDNSKYVRMQEAANKLIDLISDNGSNTNVRFGIVPFAALVHLDLDPTDIRSDVSWSGCTQDRRAPDNATDVTPGGGDESKWGEVTGTHPCSAMADANLKIVPLNSDVAVVKTALDAMEPYLWTHIALGAEFGWHVLSPNQPFDEGAAYSDANTLKIFVLLSDGMQTAPGWGEDGLQSVENAEANLQTICTRMKTEKIRVYTIGYDLSDAATLQALSDCAGAKGKFFDEKDVDNGLMATFGSIGLDVKSALLRVSK